MCRCVGQCGTRLGRRSQITWGHILLLHLHLHTKKKAKILRANLASTSVERKRTDDVVKCLWPVFAYAGVVDSPHIHPPEALICQMSVSHEEQIQIHVLYALSSRALEANLLGTRHRLQRNLRRRRSWHASIWNASSPFWPTRQLATGNWQLATGDLQRAASNLQLALFATL